MAKISAAMRERLLGQKRSMNRGGVAIDNKSLTKIRVRILPPAVGEMPGHEYHSLFAKTLKNGTTSPKSYGLPCPVFDYLDRVFREGTKDEKDFAKSFVDRSTEYWIPVVERGEEGTPNNPTIRCLRGKQTVYQQIISMMLDEDVGEDVTDPVEGHDLLVKKEGSGLDTVWTVHKLEVSPIHEDDTMAAALVDAAESYNPQNSFFPVKLDVLLSIYTGLTGEDEFPEMYSEMVDAINSGAYEQDADDDTGEAAEEESDEETEEDSSEEEEENLVGEIVEFEDDEGVTVRGTVIGVDEDDDDNLLVVQDGDDPETPWSIPITSLTLIEEEPEPEVAPPKKVAKKVAPKKAAPKAAPKKAAPAKAAPKKAATPKAATVGAKTVKTAGPRKPSAAASIKARLKK